MNEFKLSDSALSGLREAAQRGTLIPFVGAGASRLAGAPDWDGFADEALRRFFDAGKFSHAQVDQLKGQSPRIKLSIALGLQEEYGLSIAFKKIFHPTVKKDHSKGLRLYKSLSLLGKTFVTTNYDEWLDEEIVIPTVSVGGVGPDPKVSPFTNKREIIYKVQDFTPANLNKANTVIHLHGSLLEPDGMIITTRDYVRHYANDRSSSDPEKENRVLTLLEHLFSKKTVLFIGYGLEELEILEYVILKAKNNSIGCSGEARHYLVQGFFSHQNELMRGLSRYYLKECGIELIPYLRDHKDWDQLLEVVDEIAKLSPASDLMISQEFVEMEDLLNA
jgi:hypothetical protein